MPAISRHAKKLILKQIDLVVKKYIKKSESNNSTDLGNPFVMALLKDFDPLLKKIHGLKTSLGSEMEKIAEIIAIEAWGKENVWRKKRIEISLPENVFKIIDSIMSGLSNVKFHPNYINEKKYILNGCKKPSKKVQTHTYEYDLLLRNKVKKHYYFLEMKGPDPNTTEVPGAKRRLLSFLASGYLHFKPREIDSILGVYYNNKFPRPYKNQKVLNYFDPAGGLKVHADFWNFIGNDKSTYTELLLLFNNYGAKNKEMIWDGFSKLINIE